MRPIDADYILSALGVFTSEQPESANFMYGIRTAREIVEDAPTVGGWIRVEDRLPEIGQTCLIYGGGKYCVAKHFARAEWITPGLFPEVTHWMPLPKKPEEVGGDA